MSTLKPEQEVVVPLGERDEVDAAVRAHLDHWARLRTALEEGS